MARVEQLKKISQEHNESLIMAQDIFEIAQNGNDDAVQDAMEKIRDYCNNELELHFQHEERTIFAPIFKEYKAHIALSKELLKEHGIIRLLVPKMTLETARDDLSYFAITLKNHTDREEQELFPIIEELFSNEQLDAIVNFVPLD